MHCLHCCFNVNNLLRSFEHADERTLKTVLHLSYSTIQHESCACFEQVINQGHMFTRLELGTRQILLEFDSFSNTLSQFHKHKRQTDFMVM